MAECVHHNDTIQKVGEFAARLTNLEKQAESLAVRFNTYSQDVTVNTTEIDHLKEEFADLKDEYELNKDLIDQCQTVTGSLASQFETLAKTVKDITTLYESKVNVSDFNTYKANVEKDLGIIKGDVDGKVSKEVFEHQVWAVRLIAGGLLLGALKLLLF